MKMMNLKSIFLALQRTSKAFVSPFIRNHYHRFGYSFPLYRFSDAYHSYLFDARVQRNQNTKLTKLNDQAIKIEIPDSEESSDSSESTEILADQVTTITQSNCNESECDASNAIERGNTAQINAGLINVVSNEKSINVQKEPPKKGLLFYCPHCHDENTTNKPYDDAESIYKHWATKHAQSQKPFQFIVGSLFVCNLCEKSGTFPELRYHFKIKHHGKQFAVKHPSDAEKCGICKFIGNDLAEHFKSKHRFLADSKVICPMRLPKNVQDTLKAIDVHKEYQCTICLDTFVMKRQILEHYNKTLKHDIQKYPYEESSVKHSSSFKCDICDCSMDQSQMQDHFKNHELRCFICDEFKGKVNELVYHFRQCHPGDSLMGNTLQFGLKFFQTSLSFENGLVLNVANLLKPDDDENSIIQPFFQITDEIIMPAVIQPECSSKVVPKNFNVEHKNAYLEEQWPLQNKLIIFGLHMRHHSSDDLIRMFGELYKRTTGRPIEDSQIKSIYKDGRKLIVKLEEREQRDAILRSPLLKNLKTDDFLKLSPGIKPTQVYVEPMLTKYYLRITERVRYYIDKQILVSYLMRTWGLAVKSKANGEDVLVNSIGELENYVGSLYQLKRKQLDTTSMPGRRPSKQSRHYFY